METTRHDYAFPFRVDPASRQGEQSRYEMHVAQMIRQVLLTAPGERANLPDFGCGLRTLVFAENSDSLSATAQMLVRSALERWLSDSIIVQKVEVLQPSSTTGQNEVQIQVDYLLVSTHSKQRVKVQVV
jgi:uncharacterized protein